MLRHASTQSRLAVLLDFLVPVLHRQWRYASTHAHSQSSITTTVAQSPAPSSPLQKPFQSPSSADILAKLKQGVHLNLSSTQTLTPDQVQLFNKTVSQIRKLLITPPEFRNDATVLKHWKTLEEMRLLDLLGHAQVNALAGLAVRSFLRGSKEMRDGTKELHKSIRVKTSLYKFLTNIALLAAQGGSFDALNALARYHIRRQEPQAVLDLYKTFMTLVGDKDLTMEEMDDVEMDREETNDALATDTELKHAPVPVGVGRVQLVLAAITAHAMRDSFRDALHLYLSTIVQLHPVTKQQFSEHVLRFNIPLRERFSHYVRRLDIAKLVSRPLSFSRHVTKLGDSRAKGSLERLYRRLMLDLTGDDPFIAADPSLVNKQKFLAMTEVGWTSLLVAFIKCDRRDLATQMWDDMTNLGVTPGLSMWTALIDAYDDLRATEDAVSTWNLMLSQNIKPDALTYRAIVSALFKGRLWEKAMEVFEQYRKSLSTMKGASDWTEEAKAGHLSLYNTVLHGLCGADKAPQAEALKEQMHLVGPKPDQVTYNTFINYYGRRGQFKNISTNLEEMRQAGLEGDVFTFTTILSALLKAGKKDASEMVLSLMRKCGIKQNVAICSALIDHQLREGNPGNFQVAMRMLQRMEEDPTIQPNEITYTSVLSGIYRMSWMAPEDVQKWHQEIVERIRKRGLALGQPTYHLLIKACLIGPHEHGVEQALDYFREMRQKEIPIVNVTWYILLAGLVGRGEWGIAATMVKEMYESGIYPTASLLRLVHEIAVRT